MLAGIFESHIFASSYVIMPAALMLDDKFTSLKITFRQNLLCRLICEKSCNQLFKEELELDNSFRRLLFTRFLNDQTEDSEDLF
jgi:hypothetical protein